MASSEREHDYDLQLGAALRAARQRAGMSQEQLAAVVEVTFQQLQKYEKGTNRLSVSRLRSFCEALDTTVAAFLLEVDPPAGEVAGRAAALLAGFEDARNRICQILLDTRLNVDEWFDEAALQLRIAAGLGELGDGDEYKEAVE